VVLFLAAVFLAAVFLAGAFFAAVFFAAAFFTGVFFAVINVARLEEAFEAGDTVTSALLVQRGLVKKKGPVKVLGQGNLTKSLTVDVDAVSTAARDKIEAAGGSVR
jgi:ribosomal protein L15